MILFFFVYLSTSDGLITQIHAGHMAHFSLLLCFSATADTVVMCSCPACTKHKVFFPQNERVTCVLTTTTLKSVFPFVAAKHNARGSWAVESKLHLLMHPSATLMDRSGSFFTH
jgi:hypothetical protein